MVPRSGTRIASVKEVESLEITDVTRIATEAARQLSPRLHVIGVTSGGGDDYTEVVIDITGCHQEPCRMSLGIFRNMSASDLHDDIADKLERHFKDAQL